MGFMSDNMYILISIAVVLLVFVYLLSYYIHSVADGKVDPLKKRIKRLQSVLESNGLQETKKKLQFDDVLTEDTDYNKYDREPENEKQQIMEEEDSYFDPIK